MKHIVHMTSVHQRYDVRIFLKECTSLVKAGYKVTLIVADGLGDEVKNDVKIIDVGGKQQHGRIWRMLNSTKLIYKAAVDCNADAYHFHDPELIPIALKIKKSGRVVLFDSHENFADDIKDKPYLHPLISGVVSWVYRSYEKYAVHNFDGVIAATPSIRDYFRGMKVNSIDINNYPFQEEFCFDSSQEVIDYKYDVAYIGAISRIRGVHELVNSLSYSTKYSMVMAGSVNEPDFMTLLESSPGWRQVDFRGQVSRQEIKEILSTSKVGVVTFLPAPNHIESQPNKMFEYMSAGLPIVGSHFPLWKIIIEGNECGICVDPSSPKSIYDAVDYILSNPEKAKVMGENGRRAIIERYNWSAESKKLIDFYNTLKW